MKGSQGVQALMNMREQVPGYRRKSKSVSREADEIVGASI